MFRDFRPVAALAGILLLGGCASDRDETALAATAVPDVESLGPGNKCLMRGSISGWQPVSRDMILVESLGKRRHLVRFAGACIANPKFEVAVSFTSNDFEICPYGGDTLLIDGQSCRIWSIWELPQEGDEPARQPNS